MPEPNSKDKASLKRSFEISKEYYRVVADNLNDVNKKISKLELKKDILEKKLLGMGKTMSRTVEIAKQMNLFDPDRVDKDQEQAA